MDCTQLKISCKFFKLGSSHGKVNGLLYVSVDAFLDYRSD